MKSKSKLQSSAYNAALSIMKHMLTFFELGFCMANPSDEIENIRDQVACTAPYSCMSFWGQEVSYLMLFRLWCITNAFETYSTLFQYVFLTGYRNFLHELVAPAWDYLMIMTSPGQFKGRDLET